MKITSSPARAGQIIRLCRTIALAICAAAVFLIPGPGAGQARAAIAQRGTVTTKIGTADATTLVINVPTGVVAGDVMIANIIEYDAVTGWPTCSGWTLIKSNILAATKTGHGAVFYKVSTGSEPASYTFTLTGTPVQSLGSMVAFSGVDTKGGLNPNGTAGGPFDVTPVEFSVSSSSTTAVGATAITTATANAAVVMFGMGAGPASASTWSGWTTTSPGALAELYDNQTGTGIDKAVTIGAAWATKATAGSTGAGAATLTTSCKNAGILIALKSAATADPLTVGRSWGTQLRIPVSSVMAKVAGGSAPYTLSSVTSPNGSDFVFYDSSYIYFAPADNLSRVLTYMVHDATIPTAYIASNTITVTVTNAVSYVNSISNNVANGTVIIKFAGVPGFNYVVERSGSATVWSSATTVQTITAPGTGIWSFTDSSPPNPSFYRLRQNN